MSRRRTFPRAGDRISLALPAPSASAPAHPVRRGTVLERSVGRSGALHVRWDARSTGDTPVDSWLADATWYWEHDQLTVDESGTPAISLEVAADEVGPGEPEWLAARRLRPLYGREGAAGAAAEWEAAISAEVAALPDGNWEDVLASALGSASPARQVTATRTAPAAPRPDGRAPAPRAVAAPALTELARNEQPAATPPPPAPRTAAAPSAPERPPAPAPRASTGRRSDDILPARAHRRRRFGKG